MRGDISLRVSAPLGSAHSNIHNDKYISFYTHNFHIELMLTPHGVSEDISLRAKAAGGPPDVLHGLRCGAHRIVSVVDAREENRVEAHLRH